MNKGSLMEPNQHFVSNNLIFFLYWPLPHCCCHSADISVLRSKKRKKDLKLPVILIWPNICHTYLNCNILIPNWNSNIHAYLHLSVQGKEYIERIHVEPFKFLFHGQKIGFLGSTRKKIKLWIMSYFWVRVFQLFMGKKKS